MRIPAIAVMILSSAVACTVAPSSDLAASTTSSVPVRDDSLTVTTATATTDSSASLVTTSSPPPDASVLPPGPETAVDARAFLAPLEINDRPPPSGYDRNAWPLWKDIDADGCDARQQALIAASNPPAEVGPNCKVVRGHWVSAYDGFETSSPGDLDIDHVVPLADAYRSGADGWSTDQRALYANDQADLWAVSASSNRSKGDKSPDDWRPPLHGIWCEYAKRWTTIKIRWRLTASTAERDALGQMLDTCGSASDSVGSSSATVVAPDSTSSIASTSTAPAASASSVYYANCSAAKAAGVSNIHRGEPGYRDALDGDHDGIACEK